MVEQSENRTFSSTQQLDSATECSPLKARTLFISDIHLGLRGCQAEIFLSFIKHFDAERIYLVGDIFDGWAMKRKKFFWPQAHNDIVQKLLRRARHGAEIIYIPGNHDEVMRNYLGTHFGGVEVREEDIFETVSGKRYLVLHGDKFDMVVMNIRWLAYIGDYAYDFALWLNTRFNLLRRLWGGQYWSLSKWAKHKVKQAVNFIGDYEKVLADEARRRGVDGVICGHIHHASLTEIDGITYVNTGDWVESCTAIYEDFDGHLHLVDWAQEMSRRNIPAIPERTPTAQNKPQAA